MSATPIILSTEAAEVLSRFALHTGPGRISDYDALARHHYRAGRPATIAPSLPGRPAILAVRDSRGEAVGVLVASMPTLNGAWRGLAWPGRFSTGDPRLDAARLNREVRCISRVVVDPRYRGLGLASLLVREYLDHPLTPCTEAVAAMGRACGFFERSGMIAYHMPPTRRDARLLDALAAAGVEAWALLDPSRAVDALHRAPWLAREVAVWANASRATRSLMAHDPCELLARAATQAANRPIAYAHGG